MKNLILIVSVAFSFTIFSCKTAEHLSLPSESVKSLKGNWQIVAATRNGEDMIARFDFSQFRINFADSTYTIENLVPFAVNKNGKWSFDNPTYPFSLNLTTSDGTTKTSAISYPVVNGQRNLIITLSPGCSLNTYQYTLQKVN
jgi:hypothetical protein